MHISPRTTSLDSPPLLGGNLGWRRIEGFTRFDKTAKVVRVGMTARRRAWWRGFRVSAADEREESGPGVLEQNI